MNVLFKTITTISFILVLIVALIAPFTFLKPKEKVIAEVEEKDIDLIEKKVTVIEKPLHNVELPEFSAIRDVKTKKKAFFDFISPAIAQENARILSLRDEVSNTLSAASLEQPLTADQEKLIKTLIKKYRVSKKYSLLQQLNELLTRIDIIPEELVLVQAANESAWGTSRFARIGLNFFGIWCYREGCGMVPKGRNIGAKHEVEAFDSVEHAVKRYLHNINTNSAYSVFRTIRSQLRAQEQALSPQILATGLLPYSERGTDYVLEITEMIRHNQGYFDQLKTES